MSVALAELGVTVQVFASSSMFWLKVVLLVTVRKTKGKQEKHIKKTLEIQFSDTRELSLFLTQITSSKGDCISQSTSMHFFPGLILRGYVPCRVY